MVLSHRKFQATVLHGFEADAPLLGQGLDGPLDGDVPFDVALKQTFGGYDNVSLDLAGLAP